MRGPPHAVLGQRSRRVHFGRLDDLGAQHAFIIPQPKRPASRFSSFWTMPATSKGRSNAARHAPLGKSSPGWADTVTGANFCRAGVTGIQRRQCLISRFHEGSTPCRAGPAARARRRHQQIVGRTLSMFFMDTSASGCALAMAARLWINAPCPPDEQERGGHRPSRRAPASSRATVSVDESWTDAVHGDALALKPVSGTTRTTSAMPS